MLHDYPLETDESSLAHVQRVMRSLADGDGRGWDALIAVYKKRSAAEKKRVRAIFDIGDAQGFGEGATSKLLLVAIMQAEQHRPVQEWVAVNVIGNFAMSEG